MSDIESQARDALASITTGPWKWTKDGGGDYYYLEGSDPDDLVLSAHGEHTDGWIDAAEADADFIAAAPTLVQTLLSQLAEIEGQRNRLYTDLATAEGQRDEALAAVREMSDFIAADDKPHLSKRSEAIVARASGSEE